MRRRGHALRRRYGRTLGGSDAFTIEKSEFGPFFVVKLTRDLAVGSGGRSVPAGTTVSSGDTELARKCRVALSERPVRPEGHDARECARALKYGEVRT